MLQMLNNFAERRLVLCNCLSQVWCHTISFAFRLAAFFRNCLRQATFSHWKRH